MATEDIETILKNLTNGHEKAEILAGAYADGTGEAGEEDARQ